MDTNFAGQTDPIPFIWAAYVIGYFFLSSMPILFIWQQRRFAHMMSLATKKES